MKTIQLYCAVILLSLFGGCKKDFLDKKPSTGIVVPKTLSELQSLLENNGVMNLNGALGQISSDDCVIPNFINYQALQDRSAQNAYIWNSEIYDGQTGILDWNALCKAVFYANNVLSELSINNYKDIATRNYLKGSALFFRSYAFYDLATTFTKAYDASTADVDLGIPLRLEPRIDYVQQRANLKETYDRILSDIQQAIPLLASNVKITNPNMPTKAAAYGTLARIYLSMREYGKAELAADSCLNLYDKLVDFNTLNLTTISPFGYSNPESIFFASQVSAYGEITGSSSLVRPYSINPELLALYENNDLRLQIFFIKNANGTFNGKRRYTLSTFPFTGIATDEIYLIKAECLARRNDFNEAMHWLDKLLVTRYKTGTYVKIHVNSKDEAIERLIIERRKELVLRGSRWADLKRLNKENRNITLTRELNGVIHTLVPNSAKYIFPIPPDEIALSGIKQNDR